MSIKAMKLALEALSDFDYDKRLDAITALRQAIEQAEKQEPVAYAVYHRMGGSKALHWPEQHSDNGDHNEHQLVPLYTFPPQRQPLTDEQINAHRLSLGHDIEDLPDPWDFAQGVRAAEAAHGIKGEV